MESDSCGSGMYPSMLFEHLKKLMAEEARMLDDRRADAYDTGSSIAETLEQKCPELSSLVVTGLKEAWPLEVQVEYRPDGGKHTMRVWVPAALKLESNGAIMTGPAVVVVPPMCISPEVGDVHS